MLSGARYLYYIEHKSMETTQGSSEGILTFTWFGKGEMTHGGNVIQYSCNYIYRSFIRSEHNMLWSDGDG